MALLYMLLDIRAKGAMLVIEANMPAKVKEPSHFDAGDLPALLQVMRLVPDLQLVAYAAKLVRGKLPYPIKGVNALRPLFDAQGKARFRDVLLTYDQVERFMPAEFMPITSEEDFVRKVFLALHRARTIHEMEAAIAAAKPAGKSPAHTRLPSPTPVVVGSEMHRGRTD